jgi:hypothetical protein
MTRDRASTLASRLSRTLCALAVALATLAAAPASAIPESEVCNENDQPVLVAEQVCAWWKRQRPDVKASTSCCLPILKKIKQKQTQAYNHHLKSIDTKLSKEQRQKHHEKANQLFEQRGELAGKFKDCVNSITHALNLQKNRGTDPRGAIAGACGGPLDLIEKQGWRRCVDVDASTLAVDRLMGLTQHEFNCHYYTKSFIQTARGEAWTPPNGGSWNDCIEAPNLTGYRLSEEAHVGDLVLVKGPDAFPCKYHHSGVVIAVDGNGRPSRIRQKDGPDTCVVDLDWDEFNRVWVNRPRIRTLLYSNPDYAGTLPRWE